MSNPTHTEPQPGDTVRFLVKHQFRFGRVIELRKGRKHTKALVEYGGTRRLFPINELTVRNPTANGHLRKNPSPP